MALLHEQRAAFRTSLRKGHSRLSQREATGSPATTHRAKLKRLDRSPMETSALVPWVTAQALRVTVPWTSPEVLSPQKLNTGPLSTPRSTVPSSKLETTTHSWVSFHQTTNSFSYLAHDSQTTEASQSRMQTASPL